MRMSRASNASVLLVLGIGCFVAEAARNTVTVTTPDTIYWIDRWDDGRDEPYQVLLWKFGQDSAVYTFEESGHLKTLTAGNTKYTFSAPNGSRKLLASRAEPVDDIPTDRRRLYDCTDCEETWENICGVGIVDICSWVELLPNVFNEDAQSALTTMCRGFGAACDTSAFDTCEGQCTERELSVLLQFLLQRPDEAMVECDQ